MRPAQLVGTHAWRSYEATRRYLMTSGSAHRTPSCAVTATALRLRMTTRLRRLTRGSTWELVEPHTLVSGRHCKAILLCCKCYLMPARLHPAKAAGDSRRSRGDLLAKPAIREDVGSPQ